MHLKYNYGVYLAYVYLIILGNKNKLFDLLICLFTKIASL